MFVEQVFAEVLSHISILLFILRFVDSTCKTDRSNLSHGCPVYSDVSDQTGWIPRLI